MKKRSPKINIAGAKVRIPLKTVIINILITAVLSAAAYYVMLPPLNLQAGEFYSFLALIVIIYCVLNILAVVPKSVRAAKNGYFNMSEDAGAAMRGALKSCKVPLMILAGVAVFCIIGGIVSAQIFNSSAYKGLLNVQTGDFKTDVAEISYEKIPRLDKEASQKLGDRKMGELTDMVSQFSVSDEYTQINFRGSPVRVTPLLYGDVIKWFTNRSKGIPAYIVVDMVTQEAEVHRLPEGQGIKYSTSEHFGRYLERRLRFSFPTFMFDAPNFEIDDEGTPYYICPRIVKRIGLFGGTDIKGAVLVNAVTGACKYYENPPEWVDRVYTADLLIEQYNYYGKYQSGYWNAVFAQKNVTQTTDGYTYLAQGDDVFVYTGVTSVKADESNIGFILVNQRTKEAKFYNVAGAEEYSAMDSAQGVVQQYGYQATFPLLLNIAGQETYFMALKDNSQLIKKYAMVNVKQYQIVATGDTVDECEKNYREILARDNIIAPQVPEAPSELTVTGAITDIRSAVKGGDTYFYIALAAQPGRYYSISAGDSETAVILNVGDTVEITYAPGDGDILNAAGIKKLAAGNGQ